MSTTIQSAAVTTLKHVIIGVETAGDSTATQPVYNPATGEVAAHWALASAADLEAAVAAARTAADSWDESSLAKRTAVLFTIRELLAANTEGPARIVNSEHGKVLSDAADEFGRGLEVVEYACGIWQSFKGEYSDPVSAGIDVPSFRQPPACWSTNWCPVPTASRSRTAWMPTRTGAGSAPRPPRTASIRSSPTTKTASSSARLLSTRSRPR